MEFGKVELIKDTLQGLLHCVENKDINTNRLPQSICITPEETGDLELRNTDITQKSVQSLLYRVENEDMHTNQFSPFICMIPSGMRELSPSSFIPRVVSIGPLHKEDKNVQEFERHKVSYLAILLSRFRVSKEKILESCMHKLYASMERIKTCYVWTKTYSDVEIAEMMVMDACFILEFIIHQYQTCEEQYQEHLWHATRVKHDLILFENQIPFFILNEIFECTVLKFIPNTSLIELLHPLLSYLNLFEAQIDTNHISIDTTHHILGLFRECYKPKDNIFPTSNNSIRISSVVDLDMAGVSFKPNENPIWSMRMEVEFRKLIPYFLRWWSRPTLRMPILMVHDQTELILRNLITYEQICQTHNDIITSYVIAIDKLVDTKEDVAKLVDSGVLVNIMGSNEEATNMINNICKDLSWKDFYYQKEWETLNTYCNGCWSKHMVKLRRTYLSSPWKMIALLAGIVLFILTMVQTFFAIRPVGSN
ncbi:UPF0481 protein At3g47200-like isoform X2 [Bidens hawaiensis]|uniref:UPF0481 protein At3g47200-like isoform X2 n=1 Tax=Bidens hawaiensis TaxID=980011 RepID=UPI004048F30D